MMKYSKFDLLELILNHPDFCNFSGTDSDLRDRTKENPPLSIDRINGQWYNTTHVKEADYLNSQKVLMFFQIKKRRFPPQMQFGINRNEMMRR